MIAASVGHETRLGREDADDGIGPLEASGIERGRVALQSCEHDLSLDRPLRAAGAHRRFAFENRQTEVQRRRERRRIGVRDEYRRDARGRARPTANPTSSGFESLDTRTASGRWAPRIALARAYQASAPATRHDTRNPCRLSIARTMRNALTKGPRDERRQQRRPGRTGHAAPSARCAPGRNRPARARRRRGRPAAARSRAWRPPGFAPPDCEEARCCRKNARP